MADIAGKFGSVFEPVTDLFRRWLSVPPESHTADEAIEFLEIEGDVPNSWGDDPNQPPPGQRRGQTDES